MWVISGWWVSVCTEVGLGRGTVPPGRWEADGVASTAGPLERIGDGLGNGAGVTDGEGVAGLGDGVGPGDT